MSKVVTTYSKDGNVSTGTRRGTTVWQTGNGADQTVRVNGDVVTVGGKRVR